MVIYMVLINPRVDHHQSVYDEVKDCVSQMKGSGFNVHSQLVGIIPGQSHIAGPESRI